MTRFSLRALLWILYGRLRCFQNISGAFHALLFLLPHRCSQLWMGLERLLLSLTGSCPRSRRSAQIFALSLASSLRCESLRPRALKDCIASQLRALYLRSLSLPPLAMLPIALRAFSSLLALLLEEKQLFEIMTNFSPSLMRAQSRLARRLRDNRRSKTCAPSPCEAFRMLCASPVDTLNARTFRIALVVSVADHDLRRFSDELARFAALFSLLGAETLLTLSLQLCRMPGSFPEGLALSSHRRKTL